jgi:hypothetical protein
VKKKWGPILVERRTCRNPQDGRTVMEKAQERKKKVNLDGVAGNAKSYNSFSVLSSSKISSIADTTSIKLGNSATDRVVSSSEIQNKEEARIGNLKEECAVCQSSKLDSVSGQEECGGQEDDALATPPHLTIRPLRRG